MSPQLGTVPGVPSPGSLRYSQGRETALARHLWNRHTLGMAWGCESPMKPTKEGTRLLWYSCHHPLPHLLSFSGAFFQRNLKSTGAEHTVISLQGHTKTLPLSNSFLSSPSKPSKLEVCRQQRQNYMMNMLGVMAETKQETVA